MYRMLIAVITAMPLFLGIAGCGEEGERAQRAVENASDAALDAAEKAGNKIERWTDQALSDENAGNKRDRAADQRASE